MALVNLTCSLQRRERRLFAHLRRLRMSRIDVDRTLRIAAADVAVGRRARPQESRREEPESGGKAGIFHREWETALTPER